MARLTIALSFLSLLLFVAAHDHQSGIPNECAHDRLMSAPWFQRIRQDIKDVVSAAHNSTRWQRRENMLLRIPVVWHILTDREANRISRPRIDQEMVWLNQWFSASNPQYEPNDLFSDIVAVDDDFQIRFEYAAIDPQGNDFDGVEYVDSPIAESCDENNTFFDSEGGRDIWDPRQYFNIYTCNLEGNTLGFAYLPSRTVHSRDGAVLDYIQIGDSRFSGSTTAHESGHFLGLPHTFADNCNDNELFDDDTPNTDAPAFNYVPPRNPCPDFPSGPDFSRCGDVVMIRNNMDYNYQSCLSYFSKGQAAQMRLYLTSSQSTRVTLPNSPALPASCANFDCSGRNCGSDGCGGFCGQCTDPQECTEGVCRMPFRPNEVCDGALTLTPTPEGNSLTGDNTGSDRAVGSCQANTNSDNPLWYTFTAASNGGVQVDTGGSLLDTIISVVVGTGCDDQLSCVGFNDDRQRGSTDSFLEFTVEAGSTYFIVVDGYEGQTGPFVIRTTLLEVEEVCQPECDERECGSDGCDSFCGMCGDTQFCNEQFRCEQIDDGNNICQTADLITPGRLVGENNVMGGFDEVSCDPDLGAAVWYIIRGNGNRMVLDTCDAVAFDTFLHAYRGECGDLTCLNNNDDGCGPSLGSRLSICTQAGDDYYLAVDGYHGRWGTFNLNVVDTGVACSATQLQQQQAAQERVLSDRSAPGPRLATQSVVLPRGILAENDRCATATNLNNLGFPEMLVQVTANTKDSDVPVDVACITSEAPGLWYRFTGTGTMVRINTCNPNPNSFESVIQIISGSCDSEQCEAYALQRNSPATCEFGGDTVICTNAGEQYSIYISGVEQQQGEFTLTVRDTLLACDESLYTPCPNALEVFADSPVAVTIKDYPPVMATDCSLVLSPDGASVLANVAFFRFVAPSSSQFSIDICSGLSGTFEIEVYEGDCPEARCFGSRRTNEGVCPSTPEQASEEFCAVAGRTYIIALHSGYGQATVNVRNSGSCNIECIPVCPEGTTCSDDTCGGVCGECNGTCLDGDCIPNPPPSDTPTTPPTLSVRARVPSATPTRTPIVRLQPSMIRFSPSAIALPSVSGSPSIGIVPSASRTTIPSASRSRAPSVNAPTESSQASISSVRSQTPTPTQTLGISTSSGAAASQSRPVASPSSAATNSRAAASASSSISSRASTSAVAGTSVSAIPVPVVSPSNSPVASSPPRNLPSVTVGVPLPISNVEVDDDDDNDDDDDDDNQISSFSIASLSSDSDSDSSSSSLMVSLGLIFVAILTLA